MILLLYVKTENDGLLYVAENTHILQALVVGEWIFRQKESGHFISLRLLTAMAVE